VNSVIIKIIDENSISIIAEESDDLFILRRVVKKGDRLTGDTTRAIRQEKDFSRPDRGERIRIRVAIDVERISIDDVVDRLKAHGIIVESNNETVQKGSHHSMTIKLGDAVTLTKKSWTSLEKKLLLSKKENFGFLLVAIDTGDCGIGRISGTHLSLMPNMYSGSSGKRYKVKFNIESFFQEVEGAISAYIREDDMIVIFGPGETKKRFANYLAEKPISKKHKTQVVEGIDSGGEDGIYTFIKSESMKQTMTKSKLASVSGIIDEIMFRVNKKSNKFTMGFDDAAKANDAGAVESIVFSDKVFEKQEEDKVIEFLNKAESRGVEVYAVDSTTDVGLRVSSLGGMVSLLRFVPS